MRLNPTKADLYGKSNSTYYQICLQKFGKKKANLYWRRREYVWYNHEIFTAEDKKRIKEWAKRTHKKLTLIRIHAEISEGEPEYPTGIQQDI